MPRETYWASTGEQFATKYRAAVEAVLDDDESIVAVAPRARLGRFGVRGAGFVTDRRLLIAPAEGTALWWEPHDLAVKDPDVDGIQVRFPGGDVARIHTGDPKSNLRFGKAVAGLVLSPPATKHGRFQWSGSVIYLGGHGHRLVPGAAYELSIEADAAFRCLATDNTVVAAVEAASVIEVDVAGPGAYTTGGGWIGGGFGLEGALQGAVTAQVLNTLTTKKHVSTIIRISTRDTVAVFECDTVIPEQLQLSLPSDTQAAAARRSGSPASGAQFSHDDLVDRLERLAALRDAGALTDAEFDRAKQHLLGAQ